MVYLAKRRDILEILREILDGLTKGFSPTRIMMHSNTNYTYVKKVFSFLSKKELIKVDKNPEEVKTRYYLTNRGLYLWKLLEGFQYLLYSHSGVGSAEEDPEIDEKYLEEKAYVAAREIINKKRRNRSEIYFTILSSVLSMPRSLSSISNACFLNPEQTKKYIKELLELNMITEIDTNRNRKEYRVTARGLQFLYLYLKIRELVQELDYSN